MAPNIVNIVKSVKSSWFPKSSKSYWEMRYRRGGNSGPGSYDRLSLFKADIINTFIKKHNIKSIIDFGCGDGNQLKLLDTPRYIGLDVSPHIVEQCKKQFSGDLYKTFYGADQMPTNYKADLTMSLDVLYHLIEDEVFDIYMNKLFKASNNYVIIYSCNFENIDDFPPHVRLRKFTPWIEKYKPNFKLMKHIPNKYPWEENDPVRTSFADFYIFEKVN